MNYDVEQLYTRELYSLEQLCPMQQPLSMCGHKAFEIQPAWLRNRIFLFYSILTNLNLRWFSGYQIGKHTRVHTNTSTVPILEISKLNSQN